MAYFQDCGAKSKMAAAKKMSDQKMKILHDTK